MAPTPQNAAAIEAYVAEHGALACQAAVSQGQYAFPSGLFFGGTEPTWSNTTLRQVLRQRGRSAHQIAWIDLHTSLGPSGLGERIFASREDASREDASALARSRRWWDGGGQTPVTSIYDGSSSSALLALEYGTLPWWDVMQALRADHWLHLHPEAPVDQRQAIKQQIRDAFYVDTDVWRAQIVTQARQAMFQAVDGLSASPLSDASTSVTAPSADQSDAR
ncbi:MAG: hypothetical protein ACI83N_001080 [Hydrogenophaga sp.]|jgi:hypothetical protein